MLPGGWHLVFVLRFRTSSLSINKMHCLVCYYWQVALHLIDPFIGLSFERSYLMTVLNLMYASFLKSTVNMQIAMKFMDFNLEIHRFRFLKSMDFWVEIHKFHKNLYISMKSSHLSDLNRGHRTTKDHFLSLIFLFAFLKNSKIHHQKSLLIRRHYASLFSSIINSLEQKILL